MTDTIPFQVADLLPHTGNMVLLDSVSSFDEHGLTARLQVRSKGLLPGNPSCVPAWFGIEYMAQAVAAYAGIQDKQAGQPIKLGFLLGTRHYHSNVAALTEGTELLVSVEKIIQDDALGVFDCRITGDNIDITAKLNVYQPPVISDE
jgi:predicted hotdog family 3-hydroxylacyl-ACP dehydratase